MTPEQDRILGFEGNLLILAGALRDIETIAMDYADYDTDALNQILHICGTPAVKSAQGE